jgi:flagellar biosynthesis/type III secretory pathway ATPase
VNVANKDSIATDASSIASRMASYPSIPRSKQWSQCLQRIVPFGISGRVRSIRGTTVVVDGLPVPVGSLVRIHRRNQDSLNAEVIGFDGGRTILAPLDHFDGVGQGDSVELFQTYRSVNVCPELIGRVLDATGRPCRLEPRCHVTRLPFPL